MRPGLSRARILRGAIRPRRGLGNSPACFLDGICQIVSAHLHILLGAHPESATRGSSGESRFMTCAGAQVIKPTQDI